MAFKFYNPNPKERFVGDCAVRAITKLLNEDWDDVYVAICVRGFIKKDMPSGNSVWGAYLKKNGYVKRLLPDYCPDCYTVKEFCIDQWIIARIHFGRGVLIGPSPLLKEHR